MVKELTSKSPSGRVRRTPLTVRNRLSVQDKDPNYIYRIVNTEDIHGGDRVSSFLEHGYELVENSKVGDKRVDISAGIGSTPAFSVGQGKKAVVMRIRKEWYDEDQQTKLEQIKTSEQTMYKDAKADYGKIEL